MFKKHHILSYFDTKKTSLKKIISFMRGYILFKKEKKIYLFRKLKADLIRTTHKFDNNFYKFIIFFYKDFEKINLSVSLSQYIAQRISFRKINLKILQNKVLSNKIYYWLPKLYKNVIINNFNCKVSSFSNFLLWPSFCFLHWCYANYLLLKIFFISIKNLFVKKKDADLYFFQIQKNNTPFFFIKDSDRKSYDLISWFQNFYSKQGVPIQNINHDNKSITNIVYENFEISYCAPPFFFIKDIFKIVKFFFISLFLSFTSLLFLFLGKWSPALLLNEIFKATAYISTEKSKKQKKFLFHYSETIYRPIWTLLSNRKNSEIILYFYSTYDAPTDYSNKKIDRFYEFGNISWSKILVWDEHQKNILSNYVDKKCELIVAGPIWFKDKNFCFKKNSFKIVIFDSEVQRPSLHYGWGEISEYNNFNKNLTYLFLSHIYEVFKFRNVELIFKRKRKIENSSQTSYENLILKLRQNPKFVEIDQNVSPQYLIENAKIVISTPFTSANLYSTKKKIKNIYYDPISYVNKSDPAARGLSVICGLNELQEWEKNINYNL